MREGFALSGTGWMQMKKETLVEHQVCKGRGEKQGDDLGGWKIGYSQWYWANKWIHWELREPGFSLLEKGGIYVEGGAGLELVTSVWTHDF